jgi:hypothetical protein
MESSIINKPKQVLSFTKIIVGQIMNGHTLHSKQN